MLLNEKTACQDKIKFISDDYLKMCKTLKLLASLITLNKNLFTSIKLLKTHEHTFT